VSSGAVLISGAAGGIGQATVDRLLACGYEVAGLDVSPSVEGLRPGPYRGKVADVTDAAGLVAATGDLLDGLQLRHVVALAGRVLSHERGSLEAETSIAVQGFSDSLALNLTGQYALIQAALPRLLEADGDRSITLCSSINAFIGIGTPGYSAAKAGLIGMMRALAVPLGNRGIRINVIAPGTTHTPLVEEEMKSAMDLGRLDRVAREIPMGRVGRPDDVAAVIESLVDRMTFVTDEVISIDGGQLRARRAEPAPRRLRRLRGWLHNRPLR
jgi:NAD(P)-dependent dehydrogenase (short-subunit alcohol dehydrogenase family)